MSEKVKDPRVDVVVKTMERIRFERVKLMLQGKDRRFKDGRVTMEDEARKIIDALDEHDAAHFDAAIARAEGRHP